MNPHAALLAGRLSHGWAVSLEPRLTAAARSDSHEGHEHVSEPVQAATGSPERIVTTRRVRVSQSLILASIASYAALSRAYPDRPGSWSAHRQPLAVEFGQASMRRGHRGQSRLPPMVLHL